MSLDIQTTYSTREVCQMIGLTYRQLDWWIRTGKITLSWDGTPGSGRQRRWSAEEVIRLRWMVEIYDDAQAIVSALRSGDLWASSEAAVA